MGFRKLSWFGLWHVICWVYGRDIELVNWILKPAKMNKGQHLAGYRFFFFPPLFLNYSCNVVMSKFYMGGFMSLPGLHRVIQVGEHTETL